MSFFVPTNALRAVPLRLPHETFSCLSSDGSQASHEKDSFREKSGENAEVCGEKNRTVGEERNGDHTLLHFHSTFTDRKSCEEKSSMGCMRSLSRFEDPTLLRNTRKWAQLGVSVPSQHLSSFSTATTPRSAGGPPSSQLMPSLLDASQTRTKKSTVYPVLPHIGSREAKGKDANDKIREEEDVLTIISPSSSFSHFPPSHISSSSAACQQSTEAFQTCRAEPSTLQLADMDWQQEFTLLYDAPTVLDVPTCTSHPDSSMGLPPEITMKGKHGESMLGSHSLDALTDPEASQRIHTSESSSSSSFPMLSASSVPCVHESRTTMVGASAAAIRQIAEMRKYEGQEKKCGPPKKKTSSPLLATTAAAASSDSFFRKMKFSAKRMTPAKQMKKVSSMKDGKKRKKTETAEERTPPYTSSSSDDDPHRSSTASGAEKDPKMRKDDRQPPLFPNTTTTAPAARQESLNPISDAFHSTLPVNNKNKNMEAEKRKTKRSRVSRSHAESTNTILTSSILSISKPSGMGENGSKLSPPFQTPSFSIASIPQKVLTSLTEVEELWGRLQRALLDPDRIQSPPLFAGVLLRSESEWCSNFTEKIPEKELCRLDAQKRALLHQKEMWLSLVHGFGFRWQDEIYRMGSALGIHFLLRVLRDLRGVEVITFNAPLVLTPLLVATDGALDTTCISDVRVMAWMSAFFPSTVVSQYSALRQAVLETGVVNPHSSGRIDMRSVTTPLHRLSESFHGASHSTASHLASSTSSSISLLPLDAEARFVDDIFALAPLYRHLYGHMGAKGLLQPFLRQEKRISILLAQMKFNGILVDLKALFQLKSTFQNEMDSARKRAQEIVSSFYPMADFNIQSSDQCREVLYEHLKLGKYLGLHDSSDPLSSSHEFPSSSSPSHLDSVRTHPLSNTSNQLNITKKGKLSTAEETLRRLAPHHELPGVIIRYRKAAKIIQTYIEGILQNAAVHNDYSNGMHGSSTSVDEGDEHCYSETLQNNAEEAEGSSVFKGVNCPPSFPRPIVVDSGFLHEVREQGMERDTSGVAAAQKVVLHPNFIHEGTETGRLSCVEPNLQNLPRIGNRGSTRATNSAGCGNPANAFCWDEGREEELVIDDAEEEENMAGLRMCFVAPEKHVLVSIDFEQIELRVLAHVSGDAALIEALSEQQLPSFSSSCFSKSEKSKASLQHIDIHSEIAKKAFQKVLITPEERNLAKRIVFGTLYGAGAASMAAQLLVPIETVRQIIRGMQNSFPSLDSYRLRLIEEGRMNGFVRTLHGRIRYLPDLTSAAAARRSHAERQAFNTVVQGSAADVMKQAMLAVERKLLSLQPFPAARLQLQIHDELIFCLPFKDLLSMVPALMEAMTSAVSLRVPLPVTAKYGPTLGSLSPWTVENELGLPSS